MLAILIAGAAVVLVAFVAVAVMALIAMGRDGG